MGIDVIVGLAVAAAAAGAQTYSSREQARDAKDARRDQAFQAGRRQSQLDEAQRQNDATTAARSARMRQRALLAGVSGNGSTIATSPLGLAGTQQTALGSGPSAPYALGGGPTAPLKTLGA